MCRIVNNIRVTILRVWTLCRPACPYSAPSPLHPMSPNTNPQPPLDGFWLPRKLCAALHGSANMCTGLCAWYCLQSWIPKVQYKISQQSSAQFCTCPCTGLYMLSLCTILLMKKFQDDAIMRSPERWSVFAYHHFWAVQRKRMLRIFLFINFSYFAVASWVCQGLKNLRSSPISYCHLSLEPPHWWEG